MGIFFGNCRIRRFLAQQYLVRATLSVPLGTSHYILRLNEYENIF